MESFSENLPTSLAPILAVGLGHLPTLALAGILLAAVVWDGLRHRIPNLLTLSAALLGLGLQFHVARWPGLLDGLAGFATGFFIFLPLYAFGWMGAGDVKLMGAVGSFLGWPASLLAVSLSAGLGAVFALLWIGARGGISEYLGRYGLMLKCLFSAGRFAYIPPRPGSAATQAFPYALAIAAGTLAAGWWVGRFDAFLAVFGWRP
jgi:prepilin peptidase CpaA